MLKKILYGFLLFNVYLLYGDEALLEKRTKAQELAEEVVSDAPRLLIKIPTRMRPEKFFVMLDNYYEKLSHTIPYQFLISCDEDDVLMNNEQVIEKFKSYKNLTYSFGKQSTKVAAYNADIDKYDFDIIVCGSDDMEPVISGYDLIIAEKMKKHFPDGDGMIHFFDGKASQICNTLPIMGKKYYERFGYVYHPEYQSMYCHMELASVAKILKKEKCSRTVLFRHNHPAWGLAAWDELYARNEKDKQSDKALFEERRRNYFHLGQELIDAATTKKWSILILTLNEREAVFAELYNKIQKQIIDANLQNEVEVLVFKDNREFPIGFKRNSLIAQSSGKYTVFLDDDDDVHENFIRMIYDALEADPDCVRFVGILTTKGQNKQGLVSSIAYKDKTFSDGAYRCPPGHINTMRRAVSCQFLFPQVNFGEDQAFTWELLASGLLKTEAYIDEPYYHYRYDGKYD